MGDVSMGQIRDMVKGARGVRSRVEDFIWESREGKTFYFGRMFG